MQPFILLMAITLTILSTLLVFTYPIFEQVIKRSSGSEIWFGAGFGTVYTTLHAIVLLSSTRNIKLQCCTDHSHVAILHGIHPSDQECNIFRRRERGDS